MIYSFFLILFSPFPCGVWLFQEAVPWFGPLSAGSTMVAAVQGNPKAGTKAGGVLGMGKSSSSTAPPPAGWDWHRWTQLCPAIMDLVIKAWYFCSLGCEVLAWAELSPRWVCC